MKSCSPLQCSVASVALSTNERQGADALLNTIARNIGVPRANLALEIPDRKMPLTLIVFDLDGRLWVERAVPDGQPGEADLYDRNRQWSAVM